MGKTDELKKEEGADATSPVREEEETTLACSSRRSKTT
jgi:hypothetical protein